MRVSVCHQSEGVKDCRAMYMAASMIVITSFFSGRVAVTGDASAWLVHVKVTLEDALLEGVWSSGCLGHLLGWLHDGNALCTLVVLSRAGGHAAGWAGDGRPLSTGPHIVGKVETFCSGRG